MAGDDDPPWENEFGDEEPTRLDAVEAIPEAVPSKDSTGKYKTLPGFADAVEQTREHYLAQGRIYEAKRIFTAFRLLRIGAGDSPARAEALTEKFKKWIADNEELIRVAMNGD